MTATDLERERQIEERLRAQWWSFSTKTHQDIRYLLSALREARQRDQEVTRRVRELSSLSLGRKNYILAPIEWPDYAALSDSRLKGTP